MSLQDDRSGLTVNDRALDEAIGLFTRPLPNEGDRGSSSVVEDLDLWVAEERGIGGAQRRPYTVTYTTLAVLVAMWLVLKSSRPITEANMHMVLHHELTAEQRARLGMTGELPHRDHVAAQYPHGDETLPELAWRRETWTASYDRFVKHVNHLTAPVDPSPYPKGVRLRAHQRKTIAANDLTPRREQERRRRPSSGRAKKGEPGDLYPRISKAEQAVRRRRLDTTLNKIVAASVAPGFSSEDKGHLTTDETVIPVAKGRPGLGTRGNKWHCGDSDAKFWIGSKAKPVMAFSYGVALLSRMSSPYKRQIPEVVVGIHVGEPTGGATAPTQIAYEHAARHGLVLRKRSRKLVVDRGYNKYDNFMRWAWGEGFDVVHSYPSNWAVADRLPDEAVIDDQAPLPAPGPVVHSGQVLCPGFKIDDKYLMTSYKGSEDIQEDLALAQEHDARIRLLTAHSMSITEGPRPYKSGGRGRPRRDETTTDMSVTVICPALEGKINCVNLPTEEGPDPTLPDTIDPPFPDHPHLRPRACRQVSTTYRVPMTLAKRLQRLLWSGWEHMHYFGTGRNTIEAINSLLKNPSAGTVTDSNWIQMRGVARFGLSVAIGVALVNRTIQNDFRSKGVDPATGKAHFGPAEARRRTLRSILG